MADGALPHGSVPGWFGKLACLGDFAHRRLPPEFTQVCDAWLSRGVEASRAKLGEAWHRTYLTSPVWRFAWAPGVVDAQWWFGVMMPSVDNVGRYFPLLVARPGAVPEAGAGFDDLERWFAGVAQAALGTLQPGATLETFEHALHAATSPATATDGAASAAPDEGHWADHSTHGFPAGYSLRASVNALAHHEAERRYNRCTLWWALRPGGGEQQLSVAVGLPAADAFAALLQGHW